MKLLRRIMLMNDLAFIAYWIITFTHMMPQRYLFKDYSNPIISAWNWSFFPLDMVISFSGITGIYLYNKKVKLGNTFILISLVLTFCSGLQAISFWFLRSDFDLLWWGSNLILLCYPLYFITGLFSGKMEV